MKFRIRFSPNWNWPGDNCPDHPYCVEKRGWFWWSCVDSIRYKSVEAAQLAIRTIYEPEYLVGAGPK